MNTIAAAVLTAATPAGADALKRGKPSKKIKLTMDLLYDTAPLPGENDGGSRYRKQVVEWFIFIASSEHLVTAGTACTSEFAAFVDDVLLAKAIVETMRPTDADVTAITWALESALERTSDNTAGVEPLGVEPLGVEPLGVEPLGVEPLGVEPLGVEPLGVEK